MSNYHSITISQGLKFNLKLLPLALHKLLLESRLNNNLYFFFYVHQF